MMRFQVFLSLWSVTSCSCIDKIPEDAKTCLNAPHMSTSRCGEICKTPPIYAKKEGGTIILAVVLMLSPEPLFHCEREATLFGLPKENTTRNQWLSCKWLNCWKSNVSLQCWLAQRQFL